MKRILLFVTHAHSAHILGAECDKFNPHEKKHSTVKDACMLASKSGVEHLILMHTEDSRIFREDKKYKNNNSFGKENAGWQRKKIYTEEGKQFFRGKL